jgi:hypothetical protein
MLVVCHEVLSCRAYQPAACTPHADFVLHTYWRVFLCKYGLRTLLGGGEAPTGLAAPGARHSRYATACVLKMDKADGIQASMTGPIFGGMD